MSTSVSIRGLGGSSMLIAGLTYSDIEWVKPLDGFGSARVLVPPDCVTDLMLNAHPFTHELHIEVDGTTVFSGPLRYVLLPINADGELELVAFDHAYWLAVRFARLTVDYAGAGLTVSEIVDDIVRAALGVDDPELLRYLNIQDCDTPHEREVFAEDIAFDDHIDSIVSKLMHMRTHGREISFWCINECLGQLPAVNASQFVNFNTILRDGDEFATGVSAVGDEGNIRATAGGAHPVWPGVRVERKIEEDTYDNVESAQAAADAGVNDRAPLGFGDEDNFMADMLSCDQPWPIGFVAPGMCTQLNTDRGNIVARVSRVRGKVSRDGFERYSVGFKELLQ